MTKKQWEKLSEVNKLKYCIHLGWKSYQGKAADREIQQIVAFYEANRKDKI